MGAKQNLYMNSDNFPVDISGRLLLLVKKDEPTELVENEIAQLPLSALESNLDNDNKRKAFWINVYNSFFQILALRDKVTKPSIFRNKLVTIAGIKFSLDDIEHGILRKYRYKYSFGYFANPFASSLIKRLAVKEIDYRIHFALNCGAKSCPPIAFYKYDNIDKQLNVATKSFLENETQIDAERKEVRVTKLMQWFSSDFGGKQGIRKILANIFSKDFASYTIRYNKYAWDEQLSNFTE